MMSDNQRISELTRLFLRVGAKFSHLEKKAVDLGVGEKLFPTELHTIEAIGNGCGQTVTTLCEYFDITKGAVSQIITRLEKKGYVEKHRNADFAKEKIISLTPKGQLVYKNHQALHNQMDGEISATLQKYTTKEIAVLQEFLLMAESHIQKYIDI